MSLGQYLSEGRWLGPFNQFTLMKGPGYPTFLALGNWLGISVAMAHALFHCAAIAFFAMVCHRFVRSATISILLFSLLLWHPISLSGFLTRVVREKIYYGQLLVILAAVAYALFCSGHMRKRILFAALAGAFLGWFWLTREEGVWVLPGLAVLVAGAMVLGWRERRLGELLSVLAVLAAVFASTQVAFRTTNFLIYGKFVGVDFKEGNFQGALAALHSVRSGGVRPFISVTQATRERIYSISPSFAALQPYFEGPGGEGWSKFTCQVYPADCRQIAAGWFVWALRDAVTDRGHYSSPARASVYYANLAKEINEACARGELECVSQLVSEMPPVSWPQVVERMLPRYVDAFNLLLLLTPPLHTNPSGGSEEMLARALRFLNYPLHTRPTDVAAAFPTYMLNGWYYKSGRQWFAATVKAPDGTSVDVQVQRVGSPDIQAGSKDPDALEQRFTIRTRCHDECILVIRTPEGEKLEKRLAEFRGGGVGFDFGGGRIHVDSTSVLENPMYVRTPIEGVSERVRVAILTHYHFVFVPVLIAGLVAFGAATIVFPKRAIFNVCYLLAFASWLLTVVRTSLLVLIDVTSFPALYGFYLAPAYFLLVAGAVLSCAAWLQLVRCNSLPVGSLRT